MLSACAPRGTKLVCWSGASARRRSPSGAVPSVEPPPSGPPAVAASSRQTSCAAGASAGLSSSHTEKMQESRHSPSTSASPAGVLGQQTAASARRSQEGPAPESARACLICLSPSTGAESSPRGGSKWRIHSQRRRQLCCGAAPERPTVRPASPEIRQREGACRQGTRAAVRRLILPGRTSSS